VYHSRHSHDSLQPNRTRPDIKRTSETRRLEDLPETDIRQKHPRPRFVGESFEQNLKLVDAVGEIAKRKGVTTAQLAIAWVVRQGAIPIPGSTKMERVLMNSKPIALSNEEMAELGEAMKANPVVGERYGGAHEALLNG